MRGGLQTERRSNRVEDPIAGDRGTNRRLANFPQVRTQRLKKCGASVGNPESQRQGVDTRGRLLKRKRPVGEGERGKTGRTRGGKESWSEGKKDGLMSRITPLDGKTLEQKGGLRGEALQDQGGRKKGVTGHQPLVSTGGKPVCDDGSSLHNGENNRKKILQRTKLRNNKRRFL